MKKNRHRQLKKRYAILGKDLLTLSRQNVRLAANEERVFHIGDDSMAPILRAGNTVRAEKMEHWNLLNDGCLYVVVDVCDQITMRFLELQEDGFKLIAANKNTDIDGSAIFPDYKRKFDQIKAIYKIKSMTTLF